MYLSTLVASVQCVFQPPRSLRPPELASLPFPRALALAHFTKELPKYHCKNTNGDFFEARRHFQKIWKTKNNSWIEFELFLKERYRCLVSVKIVPGVPTARKNGEKRSDNILLSLSLGSLYAPT